MPQTADRASFFPAIEKRHGQPIAHWIAYLGVLLALYGLAPRKNRGDAV